ncbi:MAG: indole-3-glycerol phosphate synthase TrpC [Acidimicrobiales bacterium]
MTTGTYLDSILAAHRAAAGADLRAFEPLLERARHADATRGFRAALLRDAAGDGAVAVIAEVKRRSPSKGDLATDVDPAALAAQYARGGASCLSVLTDAEHFGGSIADLQAARTAVSLPVLRKDFTVGPLDVVDARLMGADCVLLIAAALDDVELRELHDLALEVELDALVEVHDEHEIERAMAVEATLVGVNQRDLVTFEVDTARAVRVASLLPVGVVRVAESGIAERSAVARLVDAGYQAVLVGEHLVTSGDPAAAVAALRGGGPARRDDEAGEPLP